MLRSLSFATPCHGASDAIQEEAAALSDAERVTAIQAAITEGTAADTERRRQRFRDKAAAYAHARRQRHSLL